MKTAQLMAVVEVNQQDRILCQREGCGHSVYKRIHIVFDNGSFAILGSECFQKLYGDGGSDIEPHYGSSTGQVLSDDERQALIDNTARFIDMLEAQRIQTVLETEQRSQAQQQEREAAAQAVQRAASLTRDAERDAQLVAMENCRRMHPGLNLATPGWQGLVYLEKRRLLREGRSIEAATQTGGSLF